MMNEETRNKPDPYEDSTKQPPHDRTSRLSFCDFLCLVFYDFLPLVLFCFVLFVSWFFLGPFFGSGFLRSVDIIKAYIYVL